jgi:VWFA-related protein
MATFLRPVAAALCMLAVTGFAQVPGPPPSGSDALAQQPYGIKVNVQNVALDVVVTDSRGQPVTNLGKEDFAIYDDKVPQQIEALLPPEAHQLPPKTAVDSTADLDRSAPNAAVALIVLDEINTRFQDEAFARYSLKQYLDKQPDILPQPVLFGAVDLNHFNVLHDYTTSKREILAALDHHFAAIPWHVDGSNWNYARFNASFAALLEIAKATEGHQGHKTLIWVGQGFPPFDPTTLAHDQLIDLDHVIQDCANALRDAHVVLYTLDPAGVSMEPPTTDMDGFEDDPFAAEMDFNIMARETGGHAFYGRNDVDKFIGTSTQEGASFYTLVYKPSTPITDTRNFHTVRVVMKNSAYTVETREGYYAHPVAPVNPPGASKHASRQAFDLTLAAQSMMTYDAVHLNVQRLTDKPDTFRVTLNSGDLEWTPGADLSTLLTKVTVVIETFDRKGVSLNRAMKTSTLQTRSTDTSTPRQKPVFLYDTVATKSPAATVRVIVREEPGQKIGSVNLPLASAPPDGVSN